MSLRENVHASGVVLAGQGVMLRGPSGSGKSLLALLLLDDCERRGMMAALVADDRLDLEAEAGVLTMRAPSAIAGMIELRGRGIVTRTFAAEAVVGLVVDLVPTFDRMPEASAFGTEVLGIALPRCPVPQAGRIDAAHQVLLVREAIAALPPRQKTA